MKGVGSDGKEEDACLEDQDGGNVWKDREAGLGIFMAPRDMGNRRRSKGGVRQKLNIH